jgi:hypothetical protein
MTKASFTILFLAAAISIFSQPKRGIVQLSDSLKVDSLSTTFMDSSKTGSIDLLQVNAKKDTLRPIVLRGYSSPGSTIKTLNRDEIDKSDYRFTGDLFNYFPFGYNVDLGSIGNPSEVFINGLGWGNISYQLNGISVTNRYQNALDLNLIQSETIDSIEVSSLASGFLYNNFNNPVSVNFITRTKISPRPYSRIKFYQAPENEGMFSGMFSAYLIKRINWGFSLTNQSADPRYKNTELSNWQFNTNIRYMPSNKLNFLINYDYSKINMGLNGGVDYSATPDDVFDNVLANPLYDDRYHKNSGHNISLSALVEFDSSSYSNFTFYYQYNLDEFRQNEYSTDSTEQKFINDNSYKAYGVKLHQNFEVSTLGIEIIAGYEKIDFDIDYSRRNSFLDLETTNRKISSIDLWSFGLKFNTKLFSNLLVPSFFVKTSGLDDEMNFGYGGEVQFNINNYLSASLGGSNYEKNINPFVYPATTNITVLEAGLKSKFPFGSFDLSYFKIDQNKYPIGLLSKDDNYYPNSDIIYYDIVDFKRSGVNIDLSIKLWKILLQSNTSFYFDETKFVDRELPSQTSFGGIYYVDTLFNQNLDLKAGLKYKFYGERGAAIYDFQKMQSTYYYSDHSLTYTGGLLQYDYQLDLFVAGKIRHRATVYLVFENLLDEQFYVVPYYPIQPRGLRLGFAWEFID